MEEGLEVVTGLHGDVRDLEWRALSPNIYGLISRMASGAVTGFFALVKSFLSNIAIFNVSIAAGAFMGVLSGALAGRASDTGIIRGAALGAIAGAVLAIEALEAYHAYWRSNQSNSHNTYDAGLLRVRDISGDVTSKGLSGDMLIKLPSFVIPHNKRDEHEESTCCTICLQDIVGGEIARKLPLCFHAFHLSCVDKWLSAHSSCPMCRQRLALTTTD